MVEIPEGTAPLPTASECSLIRRFGGETNWMLRELKKKVNFEFLKKKKRSMKFFFLKRLSTVKSLEEDCFGASIHVDMFSVNTFQHVKFADQTSDN